MSEKPNPIPAVMKIWDVDKNECIRDLNIDNIKNCGRWLHKTLVWAIAEGHAIQIATPSVSKQLDSE